MHHSAFLDSHHKAGVFLCSSEIVYYTILINTKNTSNYRSTNETHYTQENTTITTHKGSKLLILTETRYQLQQSDKELHTKHTRLKKKKN